MATGSLYGSTSESTGLYGIGAASGGTYFEWFIFQDSATAPANPTGGSWSFSTNTGVAPTGWVNSPPPAPINQVWVSIAVVDSRNVTSLVWSTPGLMTGSGLPILSASGVPASGTGLNGQLYINTATTPQSLYFKQSGAWTQLTGSTLYATAGANANITSLTGITGGISTPTFLQLATAGGGGDSVAKLHWNTTFGGPTIGLAGGNTNLQIGQDEFVYVHNNTGSTITKGQVVYISGSQGQRLTVALAQANADPTSISVIGFANENIANNADGFVATVGLVSGINTSGFADGASIWLSPTVPGGFTTTKPVAPNHLVLLGYVVKGGSVGAGSIYVFIQNGYELDELHDVLITSVANNNLLRYNSAVPAWVNIPGPSGTIVGTSDTQTLTNKTISGASNTLTNIPNSALVNSSVNINGVNFTLGAVQTIGPNWILPSYAGNAGKVLAVNPSASDVQWVTASGVGTVTSIDVSGGTTGLTTSGGPVTAAGVITLGGTLGISNGGTGATNATAAFNALAPSQTGNSGKFLTTNGTNASWATITGTINYQGTWNAATNTPTITSGVGVNGYYYVVSVAGSTNIDGITDWQVGDWLIYNGTAWQKIDQSNTVTSVAGRTGAVVLTTADIGGLGTIATQNASNVSVTGGSINGTTIGATTPSTGAFTTLTTSSTVTHNAGTANGVAYLNGSKVLTTGSALTFDGAKFVNSSGISGAIIQSTDTGTTGSFLRMLGDASSGNLINWTTGTALRFATSADNFGSFAEQMRLTSTGLGIGTSSPAYKLDARGIAGVFNAGLDATLQPTLYLGHPSYTTTYLNKISTSVSATPTFQLMQFSVANGASTYADVMTLSGLGNVGIGTSSPATKLHLSGPGGSAPKFTLEEGGAQSVIYATRNTTTNGDLRFQTMIGGTIADRMLIDYSGNVGIGTSSPAYKVDVSSSGTTVVRSYAGAGNQAYVSVAGNAGVPGTSSFDIIQDGSSNTFLYNRANTYMAFGTNNTERARITSGGDLLVGTTSSGGAASNSVRVLGGLFSTVNGSTASTASGTAVTLFASPAEATFMVTAYIFGTSAPTGYNAVAIVKTSGSVATITTISSATNMTLSISGLNVQATQTSGASQVIVYSAIRIA